MTDTRKILSEVTKQPQELAALKALFPRIRIDAQYAVSPVKNLTPSRYKIKGMTKQAAVDMLKDAGWKIEGEVEHRNGSTTGMTNGEMHITLYDSGKYPYYFGDTAIEIAPTRGDRPYSGPSVVEPAAPTPPRRSEAFGGKINIIPSREVIAGTVINTPAGFNTVAEVIPDDDRANRLIYFRCADGSMWDADIDGEVEVQAVAEAKQPAHIPAPGEIHVPRDFEKKRGRLVPQPTRIQLSRLAPPSERTAELGDRVTFPGRKRATVIRDPAVDKVVRAIQGFLGDTEGGSEAENCWTLAIDAAHEAGYPGEMGIRIAKAACKQLGYPQR